MKQQVTAFELYADYGTFEVIDPEVPGGQLEYDFYKHKYEFAKGEAIFSTCGDYVNLAWIEVWLADEIQVGSDARYAVVVPFEVGKSGIHVDLNTQVPADIPEGHYALVFEMRFRDEEADDDSGAFCRLTFVPQDSVEARELVPYDERYFKQWYFYSCHPQCVIADNDPNASGIQLDSHEMSVDYHLGLDYNRIEIFDYSLEEVVFDPDRPEYDLLAVNPYNYEYSLAQAGFRISPTCSHALVVIWLADEIIVRPDTLYAAVVPFSMGQSGVFLTAMRHGSQHPITNLPEGNYALLYEFKLRDETNKEYQKGDWYEDDLKDGTQGGHCRLTFVPQASVEAQELIQWNNDHFSG